KSRGLVDEFHAAEASVRETAQAISGPLRISASLSLGESALAPIIAKMHETFPELTIYLDLTDRLVDLVEERIDIALRFGDLGNLDLIAKPIGAAARALYASPSYAKRFGLPRTLEQLQDRSLLLTGLDEQSNRMTLLHGKKTLQLEIKRRILTGSGFSVVSLARCGAGICQAGMFLAEDWVRRGELTRVLPQYTGTSLPVHALRVPSRFERPKTKTTTEFLISALRALPGIHSGGAPASSSRARPNERS